MHVRVNIKLNISDRGGPASNICIICQLKFLGKTRQSYLILELSIGLAISNGTSCKILPSDVLETWDYFTNRANCWTHSNANTVAYVPSNHLLCNDQSLYC